MRTWFVSDIFELWLRLCLGLASVLAPVLAPVIADLLPLDCIPVWLGTGD